MVDIVPPGGEVMTVSAAELLGSDDSARRDLPWRNPDVTAWQIPVSEFMLQRTPVAPPARTTGGWSDSGATVWARHRH